jgi:hypothetical protein
MFEAGGQFSCWRPNAIAFTQLTISNTNRLVAAARAADRCHFGLLILRVAAFIITGLSFQSMFAKSTQAELTLLNPLLAL